MKKPETKANANYQCQKCGFTYDPAAGLEDAGIQKGTAFDDIKASWKCPGCGNPKSKFKEITNPLEDAIDIIGKYYEGTPKRGFEHED
ncbi:MAG: rubredoxin [DPANN group archaeon]|nr:rubredoxin [DPANN group archaeon]